MTQIIPKLAPPQLEIRLREQPQNHNFKRFLLFRNEAGEPIRIPIKFKKKEELVYEVAEFPEGIEKFDLIMSNGNRSYWDRIFLENRRGKTDLLLSEVRFSLEYDTPTGKSGPISLIDCPVRETLPAGETKILLTPYAFGTQYKKQSLALNEPEIVRMAIRDIGKWGTDPTSEGAPDNPKYGNITQQGAQSFIAWYYHNERIRIGRKIYHRGKMSDNLVTVFREAGKLSSFHPSKGQFIHTKTRKKINPKPGDFLQSRLPEKQSFMVTKWDAKTQTADVVTGPFPVKAEKITFAKEQQQDAYWLGSI